MIAPYRISVLLLGVIAASAGAQEKRDIAWIDQRIEAWQSTKDERRFDDIAWVADLRTAMKLAKEHNITAAQEAEIREAWELFCVHDEEGPDYDESDGMGLLRVQDVRRCLMYV